MPRKRLQVATAAVIADTHLREGLDRLPAACLERLASADLILHAGDVSSVRAYDELVALGPTVHAVAGNVEAPELRARLPETETIEGEGARITIVHDAGARHGRLERLRRRFPEADAVVFGHSHMPLCERRGGFQIFNPGSPTQRRRAPARTMGLARIKGGEIEFELVELPAAQRPPRRTARGLSPSL